MRGIVALVALAAATPSAAADATDARERFRAAYAAAVAGRAADDEALRDYVLYPYLRAVRIERALEHAQGAWHSTDDAAAEFLATTGEQPAALVLRRAWLASLARRASWGAYLEHYDPAAATTALECQRFNARIARGETAGLAPQIRGRWLTGQRLPSECEPAFQWLRVADELPEELAIERIGLLLDNGHAAFARILMARLSRDTVTPLLERADFIEQPARMLDAWADDTAHDVPAAVILDAWSRLTRNAPAQALPRYAAVAERMATTEHVEQLSLALAKGLAWDRRAEALDYFARVPRASLDDVGREWWARAALWAGDWGTVRAAIAAMPGAQQADWPWLYWTARAAEEQGDSDTARALYRATLQGDNYYSAMAAAHLGERVVPRLDPIPFDPATVETMAAAAGFQRARELVLVGLRDLATNEWREAYARLPEDQRLQAVHLAAGWGIYDVAIATATSHSRFNDYPLLYPRPFEREVAAATQVTAVAPHLLYGVLRQESLFRADAASSAGALGIAQLTPATARETARRWQLPAPTRMELFDPAINIRLGAARIAELLAKFDAEAPIALGAYNAGETAVRRWLPSAAIDRDIWIENIPYNETRAYVRRVLWHSLVFRWLETGRPQSTLDWVGQIPAAVNAASPRDER